MPRLEVERQNLSFFDPRNGTPNKALLQSQYDPSQPGVPQLATASGLLVPDYRIERRLDHFPADLYDLRAESHLVRFLNALLGDSGAGSARKRYLMARLQTAMTSTHFYDLDRFYGAIFGAQRFTTEQLPINPYTDIATPWEWEDYTARDTQFRERILALAKTIPMGATPQGLKNAAEAITGVECEIYESWKGVDYARSHGYPLPGAGKTWRQVEALGTYADVAAKGTWDQISAGAKGGLAQTFPGDRGEVTVRVKKHYADTVTDRRQKGEDEYALRRVLDLLKPANVLLTLDVSGLDSHVPMGFAEAASDSDYYEVIQRVSPHVSITSNLSQVYPLTHGQKVRNVEVTDDHAIGRPPFSHSQSASWSYNNEIVSVRGSVMGPDGNTIKSTNIEYVTDAYGNVAVYGPEKALLDPRQVEAARLASDGVLVSHPYVGDRVAVQTHD